MKVCIVLPPSLFKRSPLIGLAYLSAHLRKNGHSVKGMDFNAELSWPHNDNEKMWQDRLFLEEFISENNGLIDSLSEKILQSNAKVIGFSIWATTKCMSLALANMIKQREKDRLIVFGGPECSFSGDDLIRNEAVDVVVQGEGEETFAEILSLYERKNKIDFCLGTYVKDNGNVKNCGYRPEIEDLNSLAFPDYSDFDLNNYFNPYSLSITFYRGCIRRCAFCNTSVTWKKFRSRSAANIFQEMLYQINKFPMLRKFEVDDTALNLNLNMISELCDLILAHGLKINWGGSALILKEMDASILKKMAKAGCNCIGYGLESGSQKIIDIIGKGFKIDDADRVIRDTYEAGIETILGIIIGFPGETEDDFNATLKFIEKNKEHISWVHSPSECCIGCNSYIHRYPEKFDAILDPNGDGEHWYSKDGGNTHKIRQKRIRIFNEFLGSINVKSSHYSKVKCRENNYMGASDHC